LAEDGADYEKRNKAQDGNSGVHFGFARSASVPLQAGSSVLVKNLIHTGASSNVVFFAMLQGSC
jgi:hypothetical protein